MKRALILDVDGTLWDTTGVVAAAWRAAIRSMGLDEDLTERTVVEITGDRLRGEFGKPMNLIADSLFPLLDAEQRLRAMDICCRYEHEFLERCEDDLLYDGVHDTIEAMAKERKLYIVSNCQSGYIELFLKKSGLGNCISDFECYGNTGKYKADNIRLLMERNELSGQAQQENKDNAAYVGDTQGDCDAADEAGVPFLFAAYGFGEANHFEKAIQRFSELREVP